MLKICNNYFATAYKCCQPRVGRGSLFSDPTRPAGSLTRPDPTRSQVENFGPDPSCEMYPNLAFLFFKSQHSHNHRRCLYSRPGRMSQRTSSMACFLSKQLGNKNYCFNMSDMVFGVGQTYPRTLYHRSAATCNHMVELYTDKRQAA